MANAFDIKTVNVTLTGTLADAIPYPLFHVPAKGGGITVLEAQYCSGTEMVVGTLFLGYGSLNATNGTPVTEATIGTSFGTGGGTFPAMCLVSLDLTAAPCHIPANKWVFLQAGTMAAAGQQQVHIAFVNGKAF